MDWSFRRTKNLTLFPSIGLNHQPSLLDAPQLLLRETPQYRILPLGALSVVVVGLIIYGISFTAPTNASAPVVSPVMQTVAPVAAPVTQTVAPLAVPMIATYARKQPKGKHAIRRRAQGATLEPDDILMTEPVDAILD